MRHFTLIAILSTCCLSAGAGNATVDGLVYSVDETSKTASVARQNNASLTAAVIPSEIRIDDAVYTVNAIGDWAFYGCRAMTEVTIPASVTSSGSFAFASCNALEKVNITDLEAWCKITWKDGYANPLICGHNLYLNGQLVDKLVIPEGTTALNESAFNGGNFSQLVFPDGLETIANLVFYSCSKLESVTLPASVKSVGTSAFAGCSLLTDVELSPAMTAISGYCFENCSALFNIEIPAAVTTIGDNAFDGCASLESVHISDIASWCNITMESASSNPMMMATKLYINNQLVSDLVIPEGVVSIPANRFNTCETVLSLTLPASLTSIGDAAFQGCKTLKTIKFDKSSALSAIGESAFEGCEALTLLDIPEPVMSIGDYAFYGCTALESAALPEGVTAIGNGLFGECESLASVNIPASAKSIAFGAFFDCVQLTSVDIPDAVTSIGKSAFNGCSALSTVSMGTGIKSLAAFAFGSCNALSDISVKAVEPPTAQTSSFSNYAATISVPEASIDAYKTTDVWKDFANIVKIDAGIHDFEAEAETAAPVYYRLDGIRVDAGNLTPGIYIVRQGNCTRKITIR